MIIPLSLHTVGRVESRVLADFLYIDDLGFATFSQDVKDISDILFGTAAISGKCPT